MSYQGQVANGQTGPAVFIPDDINIITVGLVPSGGASGKIQYTLSTPVAIDAATATWRDWPSGAVVVVTDDVLTGPVKADTATKQSNRINFHQQRP